MLLCIDEPHVLTCSHTCRHTLTYSHERQAPERLRTLADWLAFEHLVSPAFEHAVMLKAKERAALSEVPAERVKAFATIITEEFLVFPSLLSLVSCPLSVRLQPCQNLDFSSAFVCE